MKKTISFNKNEKRVVLIGAGEMNRCESIGIKKGIPKEPDMNIEEDFVIALDGGLAVCEEYGIVPDLIVGDFDSLPEEKMCLLNQYPQEIIHRLPCEKDDTDTLAAMKLAIEMGFTEFVIYGGLGGRISHTMANIQSLFFLKEHGLHGVLKGNGCEVFLLKNESCILSDRKSGYLSVFAYSEKAEGVYLKNLKYELENAQLTNAFPLGVSNEFIGKKAEIGVEHGVLLLVAEA